MIRRRPDDSRAVVLVGTVADVDSADEAKLQFLDSKLELDPEWNAVRQQLSPPPFVSFESAVSVSRFLMSQGAVLHNIGHGKLGEAIGQTHEYSPAELQASGEATRVSVARILPTLSGYRAIEQQPRIAVPVCFVQGRWDMATPTELAHMYFDAVRAERGKSWVLLPEGTP